MYYHERVWILLMRSLFGEKTTKKVMILIFIGLVLGSGVSLFFSWPLFQHWDAQIRASVSTLLSNRLVVSLPQISPSPSSVIMPTPTVLAASESAALYQVVKVIDGDTITVQRGGEKHTVRLIGIDTPESVHPTKAVECFGKEAAAFLRSQLENRQVALVSDPTQQSLDRYQRWLRYVYRDDGVFMNELLVQEGYAQEYTYQSPHQFQAVFREREQAAKSQQKGLWQPAACPLP